MPEQDQNFLMLVNVASPKILLVLMVTYFVFLKLSLFFIIICFNGMFQNFLDESLDSRVPWSCRQQTCGVLPV